jgi:hypothetical protein
MLLFTHHPFPATPGQRQVGGTPYPTREPMDPLSPSFRRELPHWHILQEAAEKKDALI